MGSPVQVSMYMHAAQEKKPRELETQAQLNYGLFETRGTWWTSLHVCIVAVGEYRLLRKDHLGKLRRRRRIQCKTVARLQAALHWDQ